MAAPFQNPFKPGAGHMPPYLAGRDAEAKEFGKLLQQQTILENLVLTGLRGVGKTVLLETFKPMAIAQSWLWVGTDLSETSSVTEENIVLRLITDLSVVTGQIVIAEEELPDMNLRPKREVVQYTLDTAALMDIYNRTPGLPVDKLKAVLEVAWKCVRATNRRGIIFAYDEAQNLADHAEDKQFPLSLMLDAFQSIQRKGIPFMLALTGLPTLFTKLVDARTFAERMFRVVTIGKLKAKESADAITKPISTNRCPVTFAPPLVDATVSMSGGYPYFIQFICREVYDVILQRLGKGDANLEIAMGGILQKLDTDFFAGRWGKATDRQRELLTVIANLEESESEFTVLEIVEAAKSSLVKGFSASHVNQMLSAMCDRGLIYKNRHGKYCFAVPLFGQFIRRQ